MKKKDRYCLTLDLKEDLLLIEEYKRYHEKIWPEITESLLVSGIEDAQIYCLGTRLILILEVNESFSLEKKGKMDAVNPKVQEWEELMWKHQQSLPNSKEGEKWMLMEKIYQL
jgi:L-rhamnose mutarotase